ncbi:PREDICTED: uncharacterized protein LOC109355399 isoform X2 [Lupinus angustifolius]|uniref:uncharacterized protein LOC109355399 isoform X2 n=1 Tax=Lupinus angustifolius TaxID=3871 RepID=UPI00092EC61A|nr:PREDICTED: uncharacterized protein LOC109355399 isoform X2 [Lupinus angustifolius]
MGFKEIGFSLLIFVYFINLASSYPIQKILPSDKGIYGSKIEGGTRGGQSHGNGNGGTGAVPVYAAGAANNNHQHHRGAANCNLDKIKFPPMVMITLVYPVILLFLLT